MRIKNSIGAVCKDETGAARQRHPCPNCENGNLPACFTLTFSSITLPTGNGAKWPDFYDITSDVLNSLVVHVGPSGGPCMVEYDTDPHYVYNPLKRYNYGPIGFGVAPSAGSCIKSTHFQQKAQPNPLYTRAGSPAAYPGIGAGIKTGYDEVLEKHYFEVVLFIDGYLLFDGRIESDDPIDCTASPTINNALTTNHNPRTTPVYTDSLVQPLEIAPPPDCAATPIIYIGGIDGSVTVTPANCCKCRCRYVRTNGMQLGFTIPEREDPVVFAVIQDLRSCGQSSGMGFGGIEDYTEYGAAWSIHYGPDEAFEGCGWVRHIRFFKTIVDYGTLYPHCWTDLEIRADCWWKYISLVDEPTSEADWTLVDSDSSGPDIDDDLFTCTEPTITYPPEPPDDPDKIPCPDSGVCSDCGEWFTGSITFSATGEDDEGFGFCMLRDPLGCTWFENNPGNWVAWLDCGVNADNQPVWIFHIIKLTGNLTGYWELHLTRDGQTCANVAANDWTLVTSPAYTSPSILIENDAFTDVECQSFTRGEDCTNCITAQTPLQWQIFGTIPTSGCCTFTGLAGLDAAVNEILTQGGSPYCAWNGDQTPRNGTRSSYFGAPCTGGPTSPRTPIRYIITLTKTSGTNFNLFFQVANHISSGDNATSTIRWSLNATVANGECVKELTFSGADVDGCYGTLAITAIPI